MRVQVFEELLMTTWTLWRWAHGRPYPVSNVNYNRPCLESHNFNSKDFCIWFITIIMKIWCSKESSNELLKVKSHCILLLPWLKVPLLTFLQPRVEKLLAWLEIESTTLDLSSQSGAFFECLLAGAIHRFKKYRLSFKDPYLNQTSCTGWRLPMMTHKWSRCSGTGCKSC